MNGTTGGVYAYKDSSWSSLGGGARSVTSDADGNVYVLSNAHIVNGNSAIWEYVNGTWTQLPGSGSQIVGSLDPYSYTISGVGTVPSYGLFVLNSSGGIYDYSPHARYVKLPGSASGIAPVIGGFFELKYPPSARGEGLSYFDYVSGLKSEAGTVVLAVAGFNAGGGGQLYAVNSANAVYTTPVIATGSIYIAEAGTNTVTVYDPAGGLVNTITAGLNSPSGIAVDTAGDIYVANEGNNTVTTYDTNGTTLTIPTGNQPTGVAVDASGKIYVANSSDNTVTTYTANGLPTTPAITGLRSHRRGGRHVWQNLRHERCSEHGDDLYCGRLAAENDPDGFLPMGRGG